MTEFCGDNIAYTKGDSFYLEVLSDEGFEEDDVLEFTISPSEKSGYTVFKEVPLSDGRFCITFTQEEINKLSINDYIYKISVVSALSGRVTHKSGQFTVKWGE